MPYFQFSGTASSLAMCQSQLFSAASFHLFFPNGPERSVFGARERRVKLASLHGGDAPCHIGQREGSAGILRRRVQLDDVEKQGVASIGIELELGGYRDWRRDGAVQLREQRLERVKGIEPSYEVG